MKHSKTQDVLNCIYQVKHDRPYISVFWIHAVNHVRFEQDYRMLAALAKLPGHDDPKQDIRPVVKAWLEGPDSGEWILVLDNADNKNDFFNSNDSSLQTSFDLADFLPQGTKGTIIVTTKDREVAEELTGLNSVAKEEMGHIEVEELFKQHNPTNLEDIELVRHLLEALQYLPLALFKQQDTCI